MPAPARSAASRKPGRAAPVPVPEPDTQRARGVHRLIDICRVLHEQRRPMSVRELVAATGAPRSSVYDLVTQLADADWLQADDAGNVFFGRALHYYGLDYADHDSLLRRARPLMRQLAARFNETCQLCALDGDKYTVLQNEHGTRPFSIRSEVGVKVPIPWTASGRVLLRHLDAASIRALIPATDFTLPGGNRIDIDAFLADVGHARSTGCAVTEGLVDNFACCMAAAICDAGGKAVATLCFTVGRDTPKSRRKQLLDALLAAGRSLSH